MICERTQSPLALQVLLAFMYGSRITSKVHMSAILPFLLLLPRGYLARQPRLGPSCVWKLFFLRSRPTLRMVDGRSRCWQSRPVRRDTDILRISIAFSFMTRTGFQYKLLLAVVMLSGCAGNPWARDPFPEIENAPTTDKATPSVTVEMPDDADPGGSPTASANTVEADLQAIGEMDSEEKQHLLAEKDHYKAHLWPSIVQQRRAAMDYRRRLIERDSKQQTIDEKNLVARDAAASASPQPAGNRVDKPIAEKTSVYVVDSSATPTKANAGATVKEASLPANPQPTSESSPTAMTGEPRKANETTPPNNSHVQLASHLETDSTSATPDEAAKWSGHLAAAIQDLEQQTRTSPQSTAEAQRHSMLRLLYLVANRQEDALRPITGVSPTQQDFWSSQVFGLATYLDDTEIPDMRRRAAEAKRHLTEATAKLGQMATLSVRNLAICSEVTSFGVFEQFDPSTFKPGQEVLLYAEVDNFRSESTKKGYHTALRSSYLILDSRGQRVASNEFAVVHDYCRNPRRDFFVRYFVTLPERIYDGEYTLQLMIEDAQSNELGQSSMKFEISEQDEKKSASVKSGG